MDEKAFERRLIPKLPHGVWEDRIKRLRILMRNRNLDAMFIYSANMDLGGREWLRYFANITGGIWNVEAFTLIPLEDEPAVILNFKYLVPPAKKTSPIKDIRAYESFDTSLYSAEKYRDLVPLLKSVLTERGLERKRIGIGRQGMQGDRLPELTSQVIKKIFANLKITSEDASNLLFELIRVKTDYDIQMMRKACEITCKALKTTFESIRDGVTNTELSGVFFKNVYEEGCEPSRFMADQHFAIWGGLGTEFCNTVSPGPFKFEKGDMIVSDVGVFYRGYRTDIARTAILGRLTGKQEKIYITNLKAQIEMERALKPGVRASELSRINYEVAKKAGFMEENVHYIQGTWDWNSRK